MKRQDQWMTIKVTILLFYNYLTYVLENDIFFGDNLCLEVKIEKPLDQITAQQVTEEVIEGDI